MALQTKTFTEGSTASGALNYYALELILTEQSTDIEENTSLVSYTLRLRSGNTSFKTYSIGASVSLAGNVVATRDRYNDPQLDLGSNSTLTLLSGTTNVVHDADGKKTMAIAFSIDMAAVSYTPGPVSVSGISMTLTTIDRGLVHIDTGSEWNTYQVYIDNGSSWDLYIPYIDNGSGWDLYS